MREYRPQRSAVLCVGAISLISFGLCAFVLLGLYSMRERADLQADLWLYAPIVLLFGAVTGAFAWFLLSTFATYCVAPQGITRSLLRRQKQLLWRDVVEFQSGRAGQFGTTWTLTDTGGRKMRVPIYLLERGYGLEGFLYAYAAPVRARQRAQLHQTPQVFRYGKTLGIAMLVCGVIFWSILVGAFVARAAQPGPSWSVIFPMSVVVFGGFGLLAMGTAAYYLSYAIRLTPEAITESSLFSTKTLPLHQIAAFYSGSMPMQNGQMQQVTEVVGKNGKKIKFNAQLIDYDTLTATLRSTLEAPTLEQGLQEKAVAVKSSQRQQAKTMMTVGPLAMLLTLGLAALLSGDSVTALERQNRLDREGQPTQGVVTGKETKREGRSGTGYYLDFTFQVAGQAYQKSSPVTRDTYRSVAPGSPADVIYVPADPTISRMTVSIGRRKAFGQLFGVGFYAVLAIPTGIYMFFRGRKMLRAEAGTGGQPR